jgi:hypothetical protein
MPIDILAEAEAVAAARWRATEPPPSGHAAPPWPPGGAPAVPRPAQASAANRPADGASARGADAEDEADPWLTRQLLRLDQRVLGAIAALAMVMLVAVTMLTALAIR